MKKLILALALLSTSIYAQEACPEIEILGCYENCLLFYKDGHLYIASQIEHSPYCKCDKDKISESN